uniref:Sulfotransferase n=1 Tax=Chenopodium quinoa TaxID=63459 RepID=A0A803KSE2_CHEQI
DTFVLRPPKMSSLIVRMIMLVIVTVCGVYICSVCLKQINTQTKSSIEVIERLRISCEANHLDYPYLHYPQPETFSRAECSGNPVRFFVIVTMQRSGSGWFETLLNSHMNVTSNGEIFSNKERRDNISSIIRTLDKGLMDYPEEIVEYFNRRGVSAVFLFRRNLLRRYISVLANSFDRYAKILNGTHKSHVHSPEEAETLSKYKPLINSTSLLSALKEAEFTMAQALANFNSTRHIILYYEDLIKNHTKLVDVQDFLGIPHMNLTSRQVKIHKGHLREHIKNWDDVNKTLNGTAYAKFLQLDY